MNRGKRANRITDVDTTKIIGPDIKGIYRNDDYSVKKYIGNGYWLFKCKRCKKEIPVNYKDAEWSLHCNCEESKQHKTEKEIENWNIFINSIYNQYKQGAKIRNLPFQLQKSYFEQLIFQPCYYCGNSGSNCYTSYDENLVIYHNGIDRVDSKYGYRIGNCVSCCKYCNRAKSDLPLLNFLNLVEKIHDYQLRKIDIDYSI